MSASITLETKQPNAIEAEEVSSAYATTFVFTVPGLGTAEIVFPQQFYEFTEKQRTELKELFEYLRKGQSFPLLRGGYGDMANCDGLIKGYKVEPAGNVMTRLWGCERLFKGYPEERTVHGMGLAKAMISRLPRNILLTSWFWKLALLLRFIFFRKGLIHDIHVLFHTIRGYAVAPNAKYNLAMAECQRAANEALKRMLDKKASKKDYPLSRVYFDTLLLGNYVEYVKPREKWEMVANVLDFVWFFLENDNAYRFRIQDVVPLVDKENVKRNVIRETRRIVDILIEREGESPQDLQRKKWRAVKQIMTALLLLDGEIKDFLREFLLEIDIKKVEADSHDRYFMLRRNTYKFWGRPVEERITEAERIDYEEENMRVSPMTVTDNQTGKTLAAVKIIRVPAVAETKT